MGKRGTSRRKVSRLAPKYCEICGYSKVTQRHRITPGKEGGVYELGNVIALCPNHHAEADREMIPRPILYYIVQERIRRNGIEEEYKEYLRSSQPVEEPGTSLTEASSEGADGCAGNGSNGSHPGAIAGRLVTYLHSEPFRPIPKRRDLTGDSRESETRSGNGKGRGKKVWFLSEVYKRRQ